jgi:hypothetical protein
VSSARASAAIPASRRRTGPTACNRCSRGGTRDLARWTYTRLAGLVAVSRYTRDRLVELAGGTAFARLRVIPNAVSAEHYAAPSGVGPRAWHAHPFTLSIGEIKERKGHHLALAAFARVAPAHPDLHHYVVGKAGGDAYATQLLAGVRAAGLAERVHFLGNVDESEKIDLLQRMRVFLQTPVQASDGGFEGFGIVYLEAAACGRPAIGTRGCGAEDAVVHGVTGCSSSRTRKPSRARSSACSPTRASRARSGRRRGSAPPVVVGRERGKRPRALRRDPRGSGRAARRRRVEARVVEASVEGPVPVQRGDQDPQRVLLVEPTAESLELLLRAADLAQMRRELRLEARRIGRRAWRARAQRLDPLLDLARLQRRAWISRPIDRKSGTIRSASFNA